MITQAVSPLTGKALLQKIKDSNLPRRELAGAVRLLYGYQGRRNPHQFSRILWCSAGELCGIALEPEASKDGRGREATYRTSVHKNGSIVIGDSYTKEMGLKPGDEFEIRLGYKHIRLIQLDSNQTKVTNGDEEWLILQV